MGSTMAAGDGIDADQVAARARGDEDAAGVLDLGRPYRRVIPDSSIGAVRKVAKLDAMTHVVAAREPGGAWYRLVHRTRFTRDNAARLRAAGISEVVLRRRFDRASFPLAWMSQR